MGGLEAIPLAHGMQSPYRKQSHKEGKMTVTTQISKLEE